MTYDVVVPDLGATGDGMTLTAWLVKPNDFVKAGLPLFVVTTDKAEVEVEAFRDGYIRNILVTADSPVTLGTKVAVLADSLGESLADNSPDGTAESAVTRELPEISRGRAAVEPKSTYGNPESRRVLASPLARRIAQENGIDSDSMLNASEGERIHKRDTVLEMFRRMTLIRRFEDHLHGLFLQGLVPGTLHQCQGQEAVAVGVCSALRRDDVIFSTHRPVGHVIAKGGSLRRIAAELWGKANGCAGGKGGQMHLVDPSVGVFPSNAIVGANIPIATGAALGFKLLGVDRIAVSFFGDGAANIGAFHEGLNLAAVKNAPVIFVCENNLYAASTHVSYAMRITSIAKRAESYGIPGFSLDGMDVIGVHDSAITAAKRARSGNGPTLLEYMTFRYAGHSRGDPGGYRTKEELQHWRERDPVRKCRELLVQHFKVEEAEIVRIENQCQEEVEDAVNFARSSPEPARETCTEHVFAPSEVHR